MITTSTGAKKLESSDNWREIFPNPGTGTAGAHNATVDAQDRIQAEVAPIINGKRCSLGAASGDYVLLRNSTIAGKTDGAYQAAKAIPANTDLDSTYLGNAITGGISNAINSNLTSLSNNKLDKFYKVSDTLVKQNADPDNYEKLGTVSLSAGLWLVVLNGIWNTGKPLGIHVTIGNTAIDNPTWATETDSGAPWLSFAVLLNNSMDLSICSKGGTIKNVDFNAYRLTLDY